MNLNKFKIFYTVTPNYIIVCAQYATTSCNMWKTAISHRQSIREIDNVWMHVTGLASSDPLLHIPGIKNTQSAHEKILL